MFANTSRLGLGNRDHDRGSLPILFNRVHFSTASQCWLYQDHYRDIHHRGQYAAIMAFSNNGLQLVLETLWMHVPEAYPGENTSPQHFPGRTRT